MDNSRLFDDFKARVDQAAAAAQNRDRLAALVATLSAQLEEARRDYEASKPAATVAAAEMRRFYDRHSVRAENPTTWLEYHEAVLNTDERMTRRLAELRAGS